MPQAEPIDPGKYNFLTLMNDVENGRVRLPPFQREFVWSLGKVIDLMDSIYKGFPIGSFFYWKADRKWAMSEMSMSSNRSKGRPQLFGSEGPSACPLIRVPLPMSHKKQLRRKNESSGEPL